MAYENGKTYYLIPTCATGDATYNQKILNKEVRPLALNNAGVSASHYNKRNVNVYSLDWGTDMQWKVQVYNGFARILCAGNTAFGLDYYYGNDNAGNCDIYQVSGNDEDSKINFRTINASENLYKLQCYRNNVENNLYLTVIPNSSGTFTNGCDVRWQPLDASKATQQTWWLVPIEDVSGNESSGSGESSDNNDNVELVDGQRPSNQNLYGENYTSPINPYSPYYNWQCTWYAWGRTREVTGVEIDFGGLTSGRGAGKWHSIVQNVTLKDTPNIGDRGIIEWINPTGGDGHVAFLEKFDGTYYWFSQANKTGDGLEGSDDGTVSKRTLAQVQAYCSGRGYTLGKFLIV